MVLVWTWDATHNLKAMDVGPSCCSFIGRWWSIWHTKPTCHRWVLGAGLEGLHSLALLLALSFAFCWLQREQLQATWIELALSPTCPLCPYGLKSSETVSLHESFILPVAPARHYVTVSRLGLIDPSVAVPASGCYFFSRFMASQWDYVNLFPPLQTGNSRIQPARRCWTYSPVSYQSMGLNGSSLIITLFPVIHTHTHTQKI